MDSGVAEAEVRKPRQDFCAFDSLLVIIPPFIDTLETAINCHKQLVRLERSEIVYCSQDVGEEVADSMEEAEEEGVAAGVAAEASVLEVE